MKYTYQKEINNIQKKKKELLSKEDELIDAIYEIKEIMLNEKNHENNLITKELKAEKLEKYNNKLNTVRAGVLKNQIETLKESLKSSRKTLVDLEEKNLLIKKEDKDGYFKLDKEIEEKRRKILEKTIGIVKENGMLENGIKLLKEMEKNTTKY